MSEVILVGLIIIVDSVLIYREKKKRREVEDAFRYFKHRINNEDLVKLYGEQTVNLNKKRGIV